MKSKCSMGFESAVSFRKFHFITYPMLKPQRQLLKLASYSKIQLKLHNGEGRLHQEIIPGVEGTRRIKSIHKSYTRYNRISGSSA